MAQDSSQGQCSERTRKPDSSWKERILCAYSGIESLDSMQIAKLIERTPRPVLHLGRLDEQTNRRLDVSESSVKATLQQLFEKAWCAYPKPTCSGCPRTVPGTTLARSLTYSPQIDVDSISPRSKVSPQYSANSRRSTFS